MTPNFSTAFETFFAGCEKIYTASCDQSGFTHRDTFAFTEGSRYVKVTRSGSAHCFVDKRTQAA